MVERIPERWKAQYERLVRLSEGNNAQERNSRALKKAIEEIAALEARLERIRRMPLTTLN